jgi:hypothetical protein
MVSYHYAIVRQRGAAIELQITEVSAANRLLEKLSAFFPELGASASKLPGGVPYHWRLYGLGTDLDEAWAMIIEHFCACGWTSLDSQPVSSQNAARTTCFGLLRQTEETRCCSGPIPQKETLCIGGIE